MGHVDMIEGALKITDKLLIVIGSADEAPSLKNPFSYEMRKAMITDYFGNDERISFEPMEDYTYRDNIWYKKFGDIVSKRFYFDDFILYACGKDEATTEYINGMRYTKVFHKQNLDIDATAIRKIYFDCDLACIEIRGIPESTAYHLAKYRISDPNFAKFHKEQLAINDYKKSWEAAPFPPHFVAVDALCVWKDRWRRPHVLVGTRKSDFGNGKLAIPGGYLEVEETLYKSATRELLEEMSLEVDDRFVLNTVQTFDDPKRSQRGRMITHVHHWNVYDHEMPKVEAGDDLLEGSAQWMPIDELAKRKKDFFSDHYHIIAKMLPMVDELAMEEGTKH